MKTDKYKLLKERYEKCSGWAIWDDCSPKDSKIIEQSIEELNSNYVFVGLNISKPIEGSWNNFRVGQNDRRLRKAFNYSEFRGAFMTDLFEGIAVSKSNELIKLTRQPDFDWNKHISYFQNKMEAVGANRDTIYILFGDAVGNLFPKFIAGKSFKKAIKLTHYSYRNIRNDEDWVQESLEKIRTNLSQ